MDFNELELSEGLRLAWNAWPSSRIEAARMVIPFGIMCTPLMSLSDVPVLPYEPVLCKGCRAILNPYSRVDYQAKIWVCPFCHQRNYFPANYAEISDSNLPAELFPTYSTVEYVVGQVFSSSSSSANFQPTTAAYPASSAGGFSSGVNPNVNFSGAYPQVGSNYSGSYSPRSRSYSSGGAYAHGNGSAGTAVSSNAPGFLFVVDTCVSAEDLLALKNVLIQLLGLMPEDARVGLVSFGTMVHVHELGYAECSKSIVFPGDRELSIQRVKELLGIHTQQSRPVVQAAMRQGGLGRFLLPLSECEFSLTTAIEDLQSNSFVAELGHRPCRATGAALAVAVGLMEGSLSNVGSRIMLFVSGPPTIGPGMIVETDLGKSIRTHQDLANDSATYFKKACKFYSQLALHLVSNSHALDMFACSLDQVGLAEAKSAVESSGGLVVLAETFDSEIFKKSLQKLFTCDEEGHLKMCFNATLEVITTKEIKISGAIGPCSSLKRKSPSVSETEVGIGGTSAWKLCTLNNKTCVALFFEIVNQHSNPITPGVAFFIQFITQYQHGSGQIRLRVTTTARRWVDGAQTQDIAAGFDQEAAAALMARLAVHRTEIEEIFDIIRWLDRNLIRVASKFGDYVKEDPSSFHLSSNFSLYPQFTFHLRRSQFLQVFNNTPDETAYFRLMLNREGVVGSLIMIQPTIFSYSFEGPPVPVLLDVSSIAPDRILLFDSYFYVVVHYGSTIAQWRKLGYHNDPNYENFNKLLEAPIGDAEALISDRVPVPKFIECDQHGSQARFLLAKLNPSVTHNSNPYGNSEVIFTDDVSLQVFVEHLQRLAVQS
ncbi:hypothetical protein O6H91_12G044100 [Diphasiastrum complanatum]|uniref:Uncharacterized protein n=6 Tax=Diphasiastrum complanatum TaxID=34168 RepID=A0ACC2C152_DIPCM|nr:hypothetical protein O6H91_12G044100 [Diphasiastrum complanatum]KAJ7535740.1 hypothetical protein O6H91_12G044100 [Diphasiastrum complanatum]KAJ7535741.1 hypothetical protein O6H91_12G044100 [Diphasiastrum complanatum]KAJ7535742.1 hypothetical protein O6H91_12G044100 [Diphasiastrum complanatum]KAJ7535743.1 hypothetical protein O6H91_12G044100 [Diphasiastrum complanatum]